MVRNKTKQQHGHWLKIILGVIVIGAVLVAIKSRHWIEENLGLAQSSSGELVKMIGIKGSAPHKLDSFKSVNGLMNIEHWTTKTGAQVYFVRVPTLPMVDIEVGFDAGAARNETKGGLAYLTNTLLEEGTAEMSADQVAENFDKVGAQFYANSQRDMALVHLRCLTEPSALTPALKTLADILAHPAFPEIGFKREQQNALSTLKQQAQSPESVASRAFYSHLFAGHPYSSWVLGDEQAINALTVNDVVAFHQKYYVAKNAIVVMVGDISSEEANAIAQMLTSSLPTGEKPPVVAQVPNLAKKVVQKIDFPSAQTHILIGEPGMTQGDPDYYALQVGNHILGGNGSVTRMFNTVRNKAGLAYSAYSGFTPMRQRGPFVLGCQTRNDQAEKAESMIEKLFKEFIEQGPTEQELAQAKQNLIGGYALQFDSNIDICRQVAALGFYGLPLSYFNDFKPNIEKVTVEDVKQAFQKRISADNIAVVMVGGKPEASGAQDQPAAPSRHNAPGAMGPGAQG